MSLRKIPDMPISQDALKKRAVKTAVRKSKKLGHLVTEEELLSLKIQILQTRTRLIFGTIGFLLILASVCAWPLDSITARVVEFIIGLLTLIFSIVGVRRSLDVVFDPGDLIQSCGDVIQAAGELVADIF